ncbi:MAG: biopolymer transporter ExbD [Lentisphaeria bacterium]|jgi:biopolymer transport protein ExbD|nr:biopolymer transporter ExbD [Lentisphaeria bacterium]
MNFKKRIPDQQVGFQMAPMVDIMFILLTFFMTAFIFAQWENKLGIQVPTASSGNQHDREVGEVVINIDREGKIYINSIEKSPDQLRDLLVMVADISKLQPVIIRADADVAHKYFVQVLDICRSVDIVNVAIASLPPGAEGTAN